MTLLLTVRLVAWSTILSHRCDTWRPSEKQSCIRLGTVSKAVDTVTQRTMVRTVEIATMELAWDMAVLSVRRRLTFQVDSKDGTEGDILTAEEVVDMAGVVIQAMDDITPKDQCSSGGMVVVAIVVDRSWMKQEVYSYDREML